MNFWDPQFSVPDFKYRQQPNRFVCEQAVRPLAHQRLAASLRPCGWFILQAFHPRQRGYQSGSPKSQAMLYSADLIRADLNPRVVPAHEEIMAREGEVLLDEGSGHQGLAYLTRYLARLTSTLENS